MIDYLWLPSNEYYYIDYGLTLYDISWLQSLGEVLEELFINVEGHKVRYLFNGLSGTVPVLLLHGARYNADTWIGSNTLEVLTKEGYSAFAIDLPGFGKSDKIPGMNSTFNYSEFLFTILSTLKLKKVVLVGPSISGVISLIFAAKHPEEVYGLVPIGSAGPEIEELKPQLGLLNIPTLLVWGENDGVAPMDLAKEIHGLIRGSELFVIENGSHACYLDNPSAFNGKLVDFLNNSIRT